MMCVRGVHQYEKEEEEGPLLLEGKSLQRDELFPHPFFFAGKCKQKSPLPPA